MITNSISFPNMFDVSRGKVNIYEDTAAIANRVKLLMLTERTELHMVPNFGVGLRKYLFRYNNDNVVSLIKDNLIEQLRLWEPSVIAEETKVERGLSSADLEIADFGFVSDQNRLELTVTLTTNYNQVVSFSSLLESM